MAIWQDSMCIVLQQKGYFKNKDFKNIIKPNGTHSEAFWSAEFGACYDWLFSDSRLKKKVNNSYRKRKVKPIHN
jgi:hypothetical protein